LPEHVFLSCIMKLGWYGVATLLQALLASCRLLRKGGGDGFQEVREWLVDNGATVDDGMQSDLFEHGGSKVRGIRTTHELSKGRTLLRIPKKLWLVSSHFPEFSQAQLPSTCEFKKDTERDDFKFAAALASEAQKGSKSFYYHYLKHLPTLEELQSFLPRMMAAELRSEFAPLPIVAKIEKYQAKDKDMQECFESWRKSDKCPAKDLSWAQVLHALAWIQTRAFTMFHYYFTPDMSALLPGADMLNTAKGTDMNTAWSSTENEFDMRAQGEQVSSGAELHDLYCDTCDNEEMLTRWGVYLEDNPKPVSDSGTICSGSGSTHLKQVTQASLQDSASMKSGQQSPRCRQSALGMPQGPLRCSLARLAWETCAKAWGFVR